MERKLNIIGRLFGILRGIFYDTNLSLQLLVICTTDADFRKVRIKVDLEKLRSSTTFTLWMN